MPPCGWRGAATRCTSSRAITATARRSMREAGVHVSLRADSAAARRRAWRRRSARGLWYYSRVRALARRPSPRHRSPSQPARRACGCADSVAPSVISLHSMDYGWGFGYRGWDRPLFTRGLQSARARAVRVRFHPPPHGRALSVDCRRPRPRSTTASTGTRSRPLPAQRDESPTVLYVGRVEERKGVHVLVDAFERIISPRVPQARLRIVGPASYWKRGDGGYYDTLSARCAANARIELRGPTYDDRELSRDLSHAARSPWCRRPFPRRSA